MKREARKTCTVLLLRVPWGEHSTCTDCSGGAWGWTRGAARGAVASPFSAASMEGRSKGGQAG